MHELSHAFFCVMSGVKIHKIKLFQFGRTAGYVYHDEPQKFFQGFLISFGPLILNTLLTLFLFSLFHTPFNRFWPWIFVWLGFSFGLHAIPSSGDADTLWLLAKRKFWRNPLIILGFPFILILYILNILKKLHIDWLYVIVLFFLGNVFMKG